MGKWRRWWWTGVLVVGTAVNCGNNERDATDQEGDAGAGPAGAPTVIAGGGNSFDGENGGAAGGDDLAVGGLGGAQGGAAGMGHQPGEGGRESQANHAITDDVIADDAEVVTETCDGALGQASIELTRYCLLRANCLNYRDLLGECVWLQEEFLAAGECASQVTTCAELEACRDAIEVLPAIATRQCVDDVLHITDVDGDTRQEDCTARGLQCLDVLDPHDSTSQARCEPSGCDGDYSETWSNWCEGDDLVGRTNANAAGADVPATVTVHCPDFGYATCHNDRCVY